MNNFTATHITTYNYTATHLTIDNYTAAHMTTKNYTLNTKLLIMTRLHT